MGILSQMAGHLLPRSGWRYLAFFCLLASVYAVAGEVGAEAEGVAPGIIIGKASSRRGHAPTISLYKENILNRLPAGFRKWHPSIHPPGIATHSGKSHRLFMSGSGQFSEEGLKTLISKIGHSGKVYVVDLRAEPHGYVNGHAIYFRASSRNKGRRAFSPSAIDAREQSYLKSLLGGYEVALLPNPKAKARVEYLKVEQVATEKQLVESLGLAYVRIPVEDYRHPTDAQVDRFLAVVRGMKRRSWLHFHCKAGKGRTTLFMIMYDMMHHARRVPFDDFISRHKKLGGAHLKANPSHSMRARWANDRRRFLEKFYYYCLSDHRGFKKSWSKYKHHMYH